MTSGDTNVQAIAAAISQERLPWTASRNQLTDLPPAEQVRHLGLVVTDEERQRLAAQRAQVAAQEVQVAAAAVGAPAAVDWRNNNGNFVTPVKNQGNCGSCVSFCTCATIESAVRIKLNNPGYNIDLSEAFCQ